MSEIPLAGRHLLPVLLVALVGLAAPAQAQRPLADKIEDLRRTATVRAALAEDAQTRAYEVGVSTEAGVVTLTGEVGTLGARDRAETLARGVRGVRAVQNGLRVEGQPDRPAVTTPVAAETPPAPVYEEETRPAAQAAPEPAASEDGAAQPVYHTVTDGDTLYSIARRYGTTVEAVQRLNGLTSNTIALGQRLRVR